MERRFREKEPETQRCHMDDSRKHRAHCECDKFSRRKEELKWGKGVPSDRGKKGSQDSGIPVEAAEWPGSTGVKVAQHPKRSAQETRISRSCSCTSQELASELEKLPGGSLWRAVMEAGVRLKIQDGPVPSRVQRQARIGFCCLKPRTPKENG
nr:uncharacterized protein LOC123839932 [Mirounga angustirostris]